MPSLQRIFYGMTRTILMINFTGLILQQSGYTSDKVDVICLCFSNLNSQEEGNSRGLGVEM